MAVCTAMYGRTCLLSGDHNALGPGAPLWNMTGGVLNVYDVFAQNIVSILLKTS